MKKLAIGLVVVLVGLVAVALWQGGPTAPNTPGERIAQMEATLSQWEHPWPWDARHSQSEIDRLRKEIQAAKDYEAAGRDVKPDGPGVRPIATVDD